MDLQLNLTKLLIGVDSGLLLYSILNVRNMFLKVAEKKKKMQPLVRSGSNEIFL